VDAGEQFIVGQMREGIAHRGLRAAGCGRGAASFGSNAAMSLMYCSGSSARQAAITSAP
jgi:hypothetical protein